MKPRPPCWRSQRPRSSTNGHRHLAVIARGVKPPKWLHRPHDMPVILDASTARLTELASQAAQYWKYDKRAEGSGSSPSRPSGLSRRCTAVQNGLSRSLKASLPAPPCAPMGACSTRQDTMPTPACTWTPTGPPSRHYQHSPTLDDARTAIGHLQEAVTDFPFTEHLALQRNPGSYPLAGLSLCRAGQCAALRHSCQYARQWQKSAG